MEQFDISKEIKVTPDTLRLLCKLACESFAKGNVSTRQNGLPVETLNLLCEAAITLLSYDDCSDAEDVLSAIARDPNFPYIKLQEFLNNPPCNVAFYGALLNPQLSASELDKWARKTITFDNDYDESPTGCALESICKNVKTSAETLKYIAERPDFVTAMATAHQVNKWPDHLQFLCEALLENPKTPPEVVYFISRLYANPYDWHDATATTPCGVGDAKNPLL